MSKKRNLIFLSLLILGTLLLSSCFLNPPITEGILKGQIIVPEGFTQAKDLTGQALPDATVNIIDPATGAIIATTTTDSNGIYQVSVPPGGPYLLEAIKGGVKIQQFTPQVEAGIEYDLGTADCHTTSVALIAQAMLDAEDYPDNLADINLSDIETDPDFDDVMSDVCSKIAAGEDPAESEAIQQAVEDFLHPPTPTPTPPPLNDAKAITAFDFIALDPDVIGVINEGAKTIALTVPFGTDVTALVPTIVHTGASVAPASDTAQDFTSPVDYTVTAEDSTTAVYTVTVTVAAPVITTSSTIANGAATPIVTVTGTNFKAGIVAADLTVGVGTTGLTLGTVSFVSVTEITVAFTGTAAAGDLTIQAKTSAFDPASVLASNTLTVTVPAPTIDIAVIPGVTVPVTGATPVTTITPTAQYTGTVTWDPADNPFQASTAYTATITLIPKAGFTLTGVAANFFTVAGAVATNPIDSGVVTAVFLVVGASYGGGIVAYILQSGDTGYDANVQHGLIAATADQSTGIRWYNGWYLATGAIWNAIGFGQINTLIIVATQGAGSYAAQVCNDLTVGNYSDWFLPSKDELAAMRTNLASTPGDRSLYGFAGDYYWSSSEYDAEDWLISAEYAWYQNFPNGNKDYTHKVFADRVRAVRAF